MDVNKIIELVKKTLPMFIGVKKNKDDEEFVGYKYDEGASEPINYCRGYFIGNDGSVYDETQCELCVLELNIDFVNGKWERVFLGYLSIEENGSYYGLNNYDLLDLGIGEYFTLRDTTTKEELIAAFSNRFGDIENFLFENKKDQ